jgi:hypothetical protein
MTKTTTKYKRAKVRSKARRPKRAGANRYWNLAIAGVVIVGVALVVVSSRSYKSEAEVSPKIGEHWHGYLGVNVCGTWLPDAPAFEEQADSPTARAGIHSHGDGLMHAHPYSSSEAGRNATTGRFLEEGGWKLSETSMTMWDGTTHENGDTCTIGGKKQKAVVQWATGFPGKPWSGEARSGNPGTYKFDDNEIIAVYFLPKGSKLPKPPGAEDSLANITDVDGANLGTTGVPGRTGSSGATGVTGTTGTDPTSGAGPTGASGATATP